MEGDETAGGTVPHLDRWMAALEARHLSALRVAEVTRALRALSSAYVQRRHAIASGAPLDSAGKRAAFALFYGPLHYLTMAHVLEALGAGPAPPLILDLGCGTGAAGAAWALTKGAGSPVVHGFDRHPWAVAEARWTYRELGLQGVARHADLHRPPRVDRRSGVVAAYVLNELSPPVRQRVLEWLLLGVRSGAQLVILEPIARGVAPWWDAAAEPFVAAGGRIDEWRFPVVLPPLVALLDRAAGLNHREVTVRTLACNVV